MLQIALRAPQYSQQDQHIVLGCTKPAPIRVHLPGVLHGRRSLFMQVSNDSNTFKSCCLYKLPRCAMLREMNFVSYHSGQWDLYALGYRKQKGHFDAVCLDLILVPNSNEFITHACRSWERWEYLGPCEASILRMELEEKITAYAMSMIGNASSDRYHHWHIDVFMDSVRCDFLAYTPPPPTTPSRHRLTPPPNPQVLSDRSNDSTLSHQSNETMKATPKLCSIDEGKMLSLAEFASIQLSKSVLRRSPTTRNLSDL